MLGVEERWGVKSCVEALSRLASHLCGSELERAGGEAMGGGIRREKRRVRIVRVWLSCVMVLALSESGDVLAQRMGLDLLP